MYSGGIVMRWLFHCFFSWVLGDVDVSTLLEYVRAFPQRGGQASVAPPDVLGEQVQQLMESQLG